MWGAIALSFAAIILVLLWNAEEMSLQTRDWLLGTIGAVVGCATLIYVGRLATTQGFAANMIQIIPPLVRHEIQLKPNALLFLLMNEEGKVVDDQWRVPLFKVRNLTDFAIQDARVSWTVDLAAVDEAVRNSPRFAGYSIASASPRLTFAGGKRKEAPYQVELQQTQPYQLPFISREAEGTEAPFPIAVFQSLAFYAAATIGDETGATLPPISVAVSVSWNLPQRGEQKFALTARVVNGKPPSVSDPELILFITFEVAKT